jgi:Domain of unknown function (DUF4169)
MADIINLRRAKKNQQRQDEAKHAEANRLKFGQSKAQKLLHKAETLRAEKILTAHKREE